MSLLSTTETIVAIGLSIASVAAMNITGINTNFRTHVPTKGGLVNVVDLPNTNNLKHVGGDYMDIGYKFDFLSGGRWVVTLNNDDYPMFGSAKKYVDGDFTEADIKAMAVSKRNLEMPPVPRRPFTVMIIDQIFVMLAACYCFVLLKKLR